jgi:hypothetical protein
VSIDYVADSNQIGSAAKCSNETIQSKRQTALIYSNRQENLSRHSEAEAD